MQMPSFVKLNVDGSFSSSSLKGGVGDVFRDIQGNWIIGFRLSLYGNSCKQVEFFALMRGLEMAKTHGFQHLEINTNSQILTLSIIDNTTPTNVLSTFVESLF